MAFKSLQEIKNNIKTNDNASAGGAFNRNNLSTGQSNQLGFQTQGTKDNADQKNNQSALQQQLNKDFKRQQKKIEDLQQQNHKELDETNSREMNILERGITALNETGETINNLSGFSENWAEFRDDIAHGNIGEAVAELPETALSFAASVPLGMASIPFTAPAGVAEVLTGNRYKEAENGRVSNEKLTGQERIGQAISTGIDLAGIPFGGTGRLIGGAVTLGRTAARDAAGQAVRQAAGRAEREALESAGEAATRTAARAAANVADTNRGLRGAMELFDRNLETGNLRTQLGFDMAEEGGEEFVQGLAESVRGNEDEGTGGFKELGKGATWGSAVEQAALGAAGGALFSGLGHGMRAMSNIINEEDTERERRSVGANVREEQEQNNTVDEDITSVTPMTPRDVDIRHIDENERLTSVAREVGEDLVSRRSKDNDNFSGSATVIGDQRLAVNETRFNGMSVLRSFGLQSNNQPGDNGRSARDNFLDALQLNNGADLHASIRGTAPMSRDELMNALETGISDPTTASRVIDTLNAQIQAVNADPNLEDVYVFIGKQPGVEHQGAAVKLVGLSDPNETGYRFAINPMLAKLFTADFDGDMMQMFLNRQDIQNAMRNEFFPGYNARSTNETGATEWSLDYAESGNLGYNPNQSTMCTSNADWQNNIVNAFRDMLAQSGIINQLDERAQGLARIFSAITNDTINTRVNAKRNNQNAPLALAQEQIFATDAEMRTMIEVIASRDGYNQQIGEFLHQLNNYLYVASNRQPNFNDNLAHDNSISNLLRQISLASEAVKFEANTVRKAEQLIEEQALRGNREYGPVRKIKSGQITDTSLTGYAQHNKGLGTENEVPGNKQNAIFRGAGAAPSMGTGYDNSFSETTGFNFAELSDNTIQKLIETALGKIRAGEEAEDLIISAVRKATQSRMAEKHGSPISNMEELNSFVDDFVDAYNDVVKKFNAALQKSGKLSIIPKIQLIKINHNESIQTKLKNDILLDKLFYVYKTSRLSAFFAFEETGYLRNNTLEQAVGGQRNYSGFTTNDNNYWLTDFAVSDAELAEYIPTFLKDLYERDVARNEKAYEDFGKWVSSSEDFKFHERAAKARAAYNNYQEVLNNPNSTAFERQERLSAYQLALDDFTGLFDRIIGVLDKSVVRYFRLFFVQDIIMNPDELTQSLFSGNKDTIFSGLIGAYTTYNLRRINTMKDSMIACLEGRDPNGAAAFLEGLLNELTMVSTISPFYRQLCATLQSYTMQFIEDVNQGRKTLERALTDFHRQWNLADGLCSATVPFAEKKNIIQSQLYANSKVDYFFGDILQTMESTATESTFSTKLRSAQRHIDLPSDHVNSIQKCWTDQMDKFDTAQSFVHFLREQTLENQIKSTANLSALHAYDSMVNFDKKNREKGTATEIAGLSLEERYLQSREYATTFEEKATEELEPLTRTESTFLKDETDLFEIMFNSDAYARTVLRFDGAEVRDFTGFWQVVTGETIESVNDLEKRHLEALANRFPFIVQRFYPKQISLGLTSKNECSPRITTSNELFADAVKDYQTRTTKNEDECKRRNIRNSVKRDLVGETAFNQLVASMTLSKILSQQHVEVVSDVSYIEFSKVYNEKEDELVDLILEQVAIYKDRNDVTRDDLAGRQIDYDVNRTERDDPDPSQDPFNTNVIFASERMQEEFQSLCSPLLSMQKMFFNSGGKSILDEGSQLLAEQAFQNSVEAVVENNTFISLVYFLASGGTGRNGNTGIGFSADEQAILTRAGLPTITADQQQNTLNQLLQTPSMRLLQIYNALGTVFNGVDGLNLFGLSERLRENSAFGTRFRQYVESLGLSQQTTDAIIGAYRNEQNVQDFWNNFLNQVNQLAPQYNNQNQQINNNAIFGQASHFDTIIRMFTGAINDEVKTNRITSDAEFREAQAAAAANDPLFEPLMRTPEDARSVRSYFDEYLNREIEIRNRFTILRRNGRRLTQAEETRQTDQRRANERHLAYRLFSLYTKIEFPDLNANQEFMQFFEQTSEQLTDIFQGAVNSIIDNNINDIALFNPRERLNADQNVDDTVIRQRFADKLGINFLSPKVYTAQKLYVNSLNGSDVAKTVAINGITFYRDAPLSLLNFADNMTDAFRTAHSCGNNDVQTATGQELIRAGSCENRYVDANTNRVLTLRDLTANRNNPIQYYDKNACDCGVCCARHRTSFPALIQKMCGFASETLSLQAKKRFTTAINSLFKTLRDRNSVRKIRIEFTAADTAQDKMNNIRNIIDAYTYNVATRLSNSIETDSMYKSFSFQQSDYRDWANACCGYVVVTVNDVNGEQHDILLTRDDAINNLTNPELWNRYGIRVDINNPQIVRAENVMLTPEVLAARINYGLEEYCMANNILEYRDIPADVATEIAYTAVTQFQDFTINDDERFANMLLKFTYIPDQNYKLDYSAGLGPSAAARFHETENGKRNLRDNNYKDEYEELCGIKKITRERMGGEKYEKFINDFNNAIADAFFETNDLDNNRQISAIIYGKDTKDSTKTSIHRQLAGTPTSTTSTVEIGEDKKNTVQRDCILNSSDKFERVLINTDVIVLANDKESQLDVLHKLRKKNSTTSNEHMYIQVGSWLDKRLRELGIVDLITVGNATITLDSGDVHAMYAIDPDALERVSVKKLIENPKVGLYTVNPNICCTQGRLRPHASKLIVGIKQQDFSGAFGDSEVLTTRSQREEITITHPEDQDVNIADIKNYFGEMIDPDSVPVILDGRDIDSSLDFDWAEVRENIRAYGADITRSMQGPDDAMTTEAILAAAEQYYTNTQRGTGFDCNNYSCYGIVRVEFQGEAFFVPLMFPASSSSNITVLASKPTLDPRTGVLSIEARSRATAANPGREAFKLVFGTLAFKGMTIDGTKAYADEARGRQIDETIPSIMDYGTRDTGEYYNTLTRPYAFIEECALGARLCGKTQEADLSALDILIREDRSYNPFTTTGFNNILNNSPRRADYERELRQIDVALRDSQYGDNLIYCNDFTNFALYRDIVDGTLELSQTGNPAIDNAYNNAIRRVFRACAQCGVNPFYLLCTSSREDVNNNFERHSNFMYKTDELAILANRIGSTSIMRDFFSFATATDAKPTGLVQPTFVDTQRPGTLRAWERRKNDPTRDDWYLIYEDFVVFIPLYNPDGSIAQVILGRVYGSTVQPSHDQDTLSDSTNTSKGPIKSISLGMLNGQQSTDRNLLMTAIQNYYNACITEERDEIQASCRQALAEDPQRYTLENIAATAPNIAYISDATKLRVEALGNVTKSLFENLNVYSDTEQDKFVSSREWWKNEVGLWNYELRGSINAGQALNLYQIRYIIRLALGKCNNLEGEDESNITLEQYNRVKRMVIDAINENRNRNFLTVFDRNGTVYGNNIRKRRYTMAYMDPGMAQVFCRIFNTNQNQNEAVEQFLAEGREHAEATINNLDAISVNDSRHSMVVLLNNLFDAMRLANGENPSMIFLAGFRLKDFSRLDYNVIRRYTEGLTQEQFEEMRQYAEDALAGIRAMQDDIENMNTFTSEPSESFVGNEQRRIKLLESKDTIAKLLKNAVRIEQAMALANPLVTTASFLDKGVSTTTMLYALRAADADGLRGRLSPYTNNGIALDDALIETLSRDTRFTEMLDAARQAKMHNCFPELMAAVRKDPTLSPKEWCDKKFGVNSSLFDRGFNLIAEFGSAAHTWKRGRNEIFIRRLCDYLGEEGLSFFGQELEGMNGMNMLAYILQGRETGNPSIGLLELFSGDFALQAERAFNASLKADWVQDNFITVWFSRMSRNRAWLPFLQATFGSTFFRASTNLATRMLQHVAPMSTLQYLITRQWINATDDPALRAELQTTQFAASLREALLIDSRHIAAPLLVGIILSTSGGLQPPDDEDKWGNFSEWTVFGLRIQSNWWLEDILGVWLPMACMWQASYLGHPQSALLYDGILQAMGNNPALCIGTVFETILDPDAALDEMGDDIQRYADYPGGSPTGLEYLLGNFGAVSLNVLGKFITPGIIREIGTNMRDYEVSYNKIYTENVTGGLTTEAQEDGQTTYTTFNDAMIRRVTRNNPMLALIMNLVPNGVTTGYSASEMPRTKYIDSAQYATMNRLSVNNADGSPKSEEEQANLCTQIISILNDTEDLDGLYKQGFLLDSDTKQAVSQMLYDLRADAQEKYNQYTLSTNGLDYYILGDGDFQKGKVEATKYKDAFYDYKNQIQEIYNKLWSDDLNQGIKYYNRYNTTYEEDANGNYYATGFRRGLGGMLSPIQVADGTLYDPGETTGYENDWGTPSELNGNTMYDDNGNAFRALIGYEDKSYNDDKPSLDDFGKDSSSNSTPSTYGSYGSSSSSPSSSKKSSGGGGGSSYRPTQQTRRLNLPTIYSRTGFSRDRYYGADIDQLRPQYETKGSREAYLRQDF